MMVLKGIPSAVPSGPAGVEMVVETKSGVLHLTLRSARTF